MNIRAARARGARVAAAGLAATAILVLAALACDEPPRDPDRSVAAFVGDQPLYLQELENYLLLNWIQTEEELPDPDEDDVKSRLLDALIDERLWIVEAERRGVEVSDLEIEAFLDFGATETIDDEVAPGLRESEARRQLMIQKLQEEIIREQPEVTPEELSFYAERHRDRLLPAQPLELRALRLRSSAQAERIYREIRSRRMTFREAVVAYEPSPGQALPQLVSWSGLPEEVREALRDLKPGQVSEPVELHGGTFLFQVASWLELPHDLDQALQQRAREELETRRRREALDTFLERLRSRARVRIQAANLPFEYRPLEPHEALSESDE